MSEPSLELTWQYVDKWARETPDAEAIVFGGRRLTWADFKRDMDNTAKAFLELGVQRGDRVGLIAMACPEFFTTFMAANKVGASWLGMSPKFAAAELKYMVDDCRPKVLITQRHYDDMDLAQTIAEMNLGTSSVTKVLVMGEAFDGAESLTEFIERARPHLDDPLTQRTASAHPDDVTLLMYTSGSTGKPKGVEQTHRSIIRNIEIEVNRFRVDQQSRTLLHFPINHVAADVEIGFAAIFAGATTVMMDRFDPVATLNTIQQEGITLFGQVPAMYLLEMGLPKFRETDFSSVQTFVWGGAAAPREMLDVLNGIAQKTGARLVTGYGSTEVCGFVTYSEPDDSLDVLEKCAGKCAEPFEIKIVGDEGQDLATGETGEVCVRGDLLMKGYLNKAELTAKVIDADGWYHSSDLGHLDEAGNLVLCGRKSEMFKSGGENVFPREIEEVIETHPNVMFAAVIGVPDPIFQEVGKAFVMVKPGATIEVDELKALCKDRLANFKVPKAFDVRPMLPLLPNGKVNKMALKNEVAETA